MEKQIIHIKNIIAEMLIYLILVMIEVFVFSKFQEQKPHVFWYVFFGIISIGYYLIRTKIHNFWLFALLTVIPPVFTFLTFDEFIAQKIVFGIAVLIQAIISFNVRMAVYLRVEKTDYGVSAIPSYAAVIIGTGLYLFSNLSTITWLTAIFIGLNIVYQYLGNFLHYVDMSRRTTGKMPLKNIFTLNLSLVGSFALITFLLMALVAGRDILLGIGDWFLNLLRRIVRFLTPAPKENEPVDPLLQQEAIVRQDEVFYELFPEQEVSKAAEVAENILILIFTALVIVLAIAFVTAVILLIIAVFRSRARKIVLADGDGTNDIVETLKRQKIGTKRAKRFIFLTSDEKVRRIFVKEILNKIEKESFSGRNNHWTAREFVPMYKEHSETAAKLVFLYEKARYAKEYCTAADVKEAKKLAALLKS
ncbi:MAG: hypothetical protein FWC09_08120 [Lachnospiraceae bacterium]|nr:hypothetical protein [Lachnospiraceae bacterium]